MSKNRTITIDDEIWELLQELADKNYTSKSGMVRRLIIERATKNKSKKQG